MLQERNGKRSSNISSSTSTSTTFLLTFILFENVLRLLVLNPSEREILWVLQ